jgi:Transposase DDE domain group 1
VLKPVVARYQGKVSRIYFRADAGFANPEVYEFLEAERIKYAIRLPANRVLQDRIGYLLTRPVGLDLSFALTNDVAYEAARKAMVRHRLSKGGLKRGFLRLLDRHNMPPEHACVLAVEPEPDNITSYMEFGGYGFRRAVERGECVQMPGPNSVGRRPRCAPRMGVVQRY